MKKYLFTTALNLIGLLFIQPLNALDLMGIYELAKEQDPNVRIARQQLEVTRELEPQAKARLRPNVSLVADGQLVDASIEQEKTLFRPSSEPGQLPQQQIITQTTQEQYTQTELAIRLNYPIYHRDYWIQLDQTSDAISKSEKQLAGVEIDLIVRTSNAYFNVLAAADELHAINAEKTAYAKQLEQVQARFQVGVIPMLDVYESQAAYDGIVAKELVAENTLNDAWESLREIIGGMHHPLNKLGDKMPLESPDPNDVEAWVETAMQNNKNIQAAHHGVALSRKEIKKQHAGYYPTLDFIGSAGIADSSNIIGNNRDANMIGLQLIVPLYQGGAVGARERQAAHEYAAAMEGLDQQRRLVNRQTRNAFLKILSAIGQIKALQTALMSAKVALSTTQSGVEAGTRTTVDVLTATKDLYQVQRYLSRARYDYIINGLLLYQAAGTLNTEIIAQANSWLSQDQMQSPPALYPN